MKTQLILTWVSWSWKTAILDRLVNEYPSKFAKPVQFTTRKPRDDWELDNYVFLTKAQFFSKLDNWDFIWFTKYEDNYYGISTHFNTSISNIFIVEPVGRTTLKKYFHTNGIPYKWYYLDISEADVTKRMISRWDTVNTIEKRLEDFKYFCPEVDDRVLDATLPISRNIEYISRSNWVL